ncbi:MAG: alpha/beta hydrolase [Chloroflexi bacterium]|nr:alpha/beta hydrolase [Chloroflexota bacterium]
MAEKQRLSAFTRILLVFLGLLAVLAIGFVIWGLTPAKPMAEALTALQLDSAVTVETGKWLILAPQASRPTTGFIIYPGGRVDYRAYAPAAHQIAAQGNLVVIVHVPLNLAVFNPGAAAEVIAAYPEILHWAVGGHSLGGSMAANYVHSHPGTVQGLVLWASYPAGSDDLSSSGLKVLSISGTLDGLSTPTKIEASRVLLPADTIFVPIEGGDHAQFGWYGPQSGDNPATISREDQQNQIVQATLEFLIGLK